MYRITFLFFLLSIIGRTSSLRSQSLHTPAQILQIVERSTVNYTVDSLGDFTKVRSGKILGRKDVNVLLSSTKPLPLGTSPKGLSFLKEGDCTKAIKMLTKKSNNYATLSLENQLDLCHCLEKEGDWEKSISILKDLKASYPRHFEIPRMLAKSYLSTDRAALAYPQILNAWILNRNHPLIQNETRNIAEHLDKNLSSWEWLPKVEVTPLGTGVKISFRNSSNWLAYGLCSAVWEYEPEYAQQMKSMTNADLEDIQATECLMNAIITYSNEESGIKKQPEMEALNRAVRNNMTTSFILFELRLPENPALALNLSDSQIQAIVTYLDTCR